MDKMKLSIRKMLNDTYVSLDQDQKADIMERVITLVCTTGLPLRECYDEVVFND